MRLNMIVALGFALSVSAQVFPATMADAMPLSAGASGIAQTDTMIENIRAGGGRNVGARRGGGGVRAYAGPRRVYGGGYRRGYGPGVGAAVGLGVLGLGLGATAAAASQPVYSGCYLVNQPVYDSWGNYRGTRRAQVCE